MADEPQSLQSLAPAGWVSRFAPLVPRGDCVLDLACGTGRHTRLFLERGHPVVALDRDTTGLTGIRDHENLEIVTADIEAGPWPLEGRSFAGIIVVNYLHRPLLGTIRASLAPGGVLIYQTFARGNERFGKPSNPDFLLKPNELLEAFATDLDVVAFESGDTGTAVIQRICAVRRSGELPSRLPA